MIYAAYYCSIKITELMSSIFYKHQFNDYELYRKGYQSISMGISSIVSYAILFFLTYTFLRKRNDIKEIGSVRVLLNNAKPFFIISLGAVSVLIVLVAIAGLITRYIIFPYDISIPKIEAHINNKQIIQVFWLNMISLILFAPIAEEIFFRKAVYNFIKSKISMKSAVIVTSILFCLHHYDSPIYQWPGLFIVAIAYNIVYEKYHSLSAAVITHAYYNLFVLLM